MSHRAYSIVVTLAVLLAAGPAYAGDKGKGKGDKGDAAAPGEAKAEAGDKATAPEGGALAAEGEAPPADIGPVVEPREQWEVPPQDQEKARPEVAKPQKKSIVGDGKPATVGLLLGWGFKGDRRTGQLGADPYGLGLGLRGGYALDFGLYLGGYFVYYIGSTESGASAQVATGTRETHANYMLFGAEVGYDWWIGDAIIRPSVGIGPAIALTDALGQTDVYGDFALLPGLSVIVPLEDWFIGGDFRINAVTGDGVSGIAIFANGGLRF